MVALADTNSNTENLCERFFYALQDVNYNVMGLVNEAGVLVERYEYTPYGQRTIYSHAWNIADVNNDGTVDSSDVIIVYTTPSAVDSPADVDGDGDVDAADQAIVIAALGWGGNHDPKVMVPRLESGRMEGGITGGELVGLCDIGHQGLLLDREFGLYYNRARMLEPVTGRFLQRDPKMYVDGMSLYNYLRGNPFLTHDPTGLCTEGERSGSIISIAYTSPWTTPDANKAMKSVSSTLTVIAVVQNLGTLDPAGLVYDYMTGKSISVFTSTLDIIRMKESGIYVWGSCQKSKCVCKRDWYTLWLRKRLRWENSGSPQWIKCMANIDTVARAPGHFYPHRSVIDGEVLYTVREDVLEECKMRLAETCAN